MGCDRSVSDVPMSERLPGCGNHYAEPFMARSPTVRAFFKQPAVFAPLILLASMQAFRAIKRWVVPSPYPLF
jgi:hypothetical protein